MEIEYVSDSEKNQICIIIRSDYVSDKTTFFTPLDYSQQLGIINYPIGGKIKPHFHNKLTRQVHFTQEVLIVRKGKVKVNLYDKNLFFLESKILNEKDVILLASGGHGFEMLEDSEMLEIKQGPYNGVNDDKTHF